VTGGTTYHVDCSAATNGNGTTTPWNNLASVSNFSFLPGLVIVFKQGTVCTGQLIINSSGTGDADSSRIIFQRGASEFWWIFQFF